MLVELLRFEFYFNWDVKFFFFNSGRGDSGTGRGRLPRPPGRGGTGSHVYSTRRVRVTHDPVLIRPVAIPRVNPSLFLFLYIYIYSNWLMVDLQKHLWVKVSYNLQTSSYTFIFMLLTHKLPVTKKLIIFYVKYN